LINSVKTNATAILASTAGLGDVAFGVGEYKDVGDVYVYRQNQDITTSQAAAQAGITCGLLRVVATHPRRNCTRWRH